MPYPDDWELDRTFVSLGFVDIRRASTSYRSPNTMPELLYECDFCAAVVLDRKAHYLWHYPESKEAPRG